MWPRRNPNGFSGLPALPPVIAFLRNLDFAVLLIALPVFAVAEWPLAGWLVGAALWVAWRGIGLWADHRTVKAGNDLQRVAVLQGAASIGRGWLLLLVLLGTGLLISRDIAFAAALLVAVLFTISISLRLALLPLLRQQQAHPAS